VTFGCRVNQADSFQIEEQLIASGGSASAAHEADIVVVNTCSVTGAADQGARQIVRKISRENPAARIVVTGCYATRRPEEVAALAERVQIVPNDRKETLVGDIGLAGPAGGAATGLTSAERFGDGDGACGAEIAPGLAGRTAFTLRVQTGCDQTCAYCIIPTTRGGGRSRPIGEVLSEIERVGRAGYREIALTGVHLGSYGRDLRDGTTLLRLLESIASRPFDIRFRISSLEPMDCTPAIVDLVAASGGRFAPHFHLPLQHASDRMLARMQRPYSAAFYADLTGRIIERLPHASIGSDAIAGFPGESDRDFDLNAGFLAASPLSHVHVFPYSDRPGTAASAMPDKVPGAVIRERAARLRAIGATLSQRFHAAQIGTERPALTLDDGTLVVTDNFLKLRIAPGVARNTRVVVTVTSASSATVRWPSAAPADGRALPSASIQ
jgi:threonylcarbamoyladenosine tRNA methylthiotransferase MtaB